MDLLFGAADKYHWSQLKPWVQSARECGFRGEIVILVYRGDVQEMYKNLRQYDIQIIQATVDNWGRPIQHENRGRDTQSHQMRFFHLWQYLAFNDEQHRYVITTDTRDVIFQRNPIEWLEENVRLLNQFVAPTEGIRYKDEYWGADNIQQGFGPYIWQVAKEYEIRNVGTIAGMAPAIRDLSLILYSMGEHRYIPNDQSGFNLLVNSSLFNVVRASMKSAWAAQLGTTLDPEKFDRFKNSWTEPPPIIKDGKVYTDEEELFYLVHQWDRIPELRETIWEKYGI